MNSFQFSIFVLSFTFFKFVFGGMAQYFINDMNRISNFPPEGNASADSQDLTECNSQIKELEEIYFDLLSGNKEMESYHRKMAETNHLTSFVTDFPIETSCLYEKVDKRPSSVNVPESKVKVNKRSENVEYEKAKFFTWLEVTDYMLKKEAEYTFKLSELEPSKADDFGKKEKKAIEVFFSNKNVLVIAGPIESVADGYFLPWLFEVRLSKANLLRVIELCNLEIDQESGSALIKAINNNSSLLEELKIYKCTFPLGMFSSLKGKDLKNLQSFQLFCPQLEFQEVFELIKKLPLALSQLSIGEFEFNGSMETGHEFIDEIQQFKRLKTLHLYYDGNDLLKKVFSSSHNSIKLKQIQELKLYNKKSVLSTQESKP